MIQNITNNGGTGSGGSSGGVSNDAIDDLQEQINNNKAAIENNTSSINTNTTAIGNNLTEINTLKDKNLFLYAYPVGSIFISDTNTNPGTIYGGTWELIGKQFKTTSGSIDTNIFANNTTNVQNVSGSYLLSGNTVSIRLALITNVALTDTSVTLGTFNWNKLGITSPSNNFDRYVAASDDGNAVIATTLAYDTGILQSVDVYGTDSMSAGTYMALHYIFNMRSDRMLDTVCDKFYFKRTA